MVLRLLVSPGVPTSVLPRCRQARRVFWLSFPAQLSPVPTQSLQGSTHILVSNSASSAQQLLLCMPGAVLHGPGLAGTAEPDVISPPYR